MTISNESKNTYFETFTQLHQKGVPLSRLYQDYFLKEDKEISNSFIEFLGEIKTKEAHHLLLTIVQQANDSELRRNAIEILIEFNPPEIIPSLISLLAQPREELIQNTIRALQKIGSEALLPLILALQNPNGRIRNYAAITLGKLRSEQAIRPLIQALNDRQTQVRSSAIKALGKLKAEEAIDPLIDLLRDADHTVQRNAARALKRINIELTLQKLLEDVKSPNTTTRRNAACCLIQLQPENTLELFLPLLNDSDTIVRQYAVEGLRKIGVEQAFIPLLNALSDNNGGVQRGVLKVFQQLDQTVLLGKLNHILDVGDDRTRRQAVIAVDRLNISSYDFLMRALNDENDWVRAQAITTLAHIGTPETNVLLLTRLHDKSHWVRLAVIEAIQALEMRHTSPELITSLKDRSLEVRLATIKTLGIFKVKEAVDAITEIVLNADGFEDDRVREQAVWALGEIGDLEAIQILIETLEDLSWSVRQMAKQKLKQLGSKAESALKNALRNSNSEIRNQSREVLQEISAMNG